MHEADHAPGELALNQTKAFQPAATSRGLWTFEEPKMKSYLSLVLLALPGCFAQTEAPPEPAPAPVECAFPQGVCPAGNVYEEHEQFNDGAGCFVLSAVCYPEGTPADRVPADCFTKVSLACP